MKEPKGEIRSVGKAMELLELFFAWRKPMSLQQLAEATQYPKSTVHSLLATLHFLRRTGIHHAKIVKGRAAWTRWSIPSTPCRKGTWTQRLLRCTRKK